MGYSVAGPEWDCGCCGGLEKWEGYQRVLATMVEILIGSLSNKMGHSLLAVRDINLKYIVVEWIS